MPDDRIEGRNQVIEALRAGRPLHKILIARDDTGVLRQVAVMAREAGVPVVRTAGAALDRLARTRNHQGVIALAAPRGYASVDALLAGAGKRGLPFLLLLDGVMDPQNLGSLIRTAEAMGVDGVILPHRRAAGLTPLVERASAGALEYVPVARVANLTRTMADLKERGYWFIGAEAGMGRGTLPALDRPVGLVLGGEGTGLHRLVRESCDFLISLPMYGRINSLNVGAAGAIILHALAEQLRSPAGAGAR